MTWREVAINYNAADESPTTLFKINLKYNFEIGSTDSLNLHISLSKVQDVATHNSDSVQMLITYKWRKLGWISQSLCFVYFAYLIALFYHADNYTEVSSIYPLIFFFVFFTSLELLSIAVDYKENYTSDIFNYVDFGYLSLLLTYIIMYFVCVTTATLGILYPVVNLLSWLRGLS